ncbi:MAG TPA: carboxypeptidase-like regulatory domain-containing protein [Planctomycetota bacterium]
MNAKAIVAVLLAVLGVACWFLLRGDADVEPRLNPVDVPQPAAASPKAEPQRQDVGRAAAVDPGLDRTAVPAANLGNAPGSGATMVRGRIVDGAGSPRGAIELSVRSWARVDGMEGIDLANLPEAGGPSRTRSEPKPDCTTRADGTFQFPLAADRDARLELISDTMIFANRVPMIRGAKADQDLGDVVVVKGGSLRGIVQDEHGKPVADVRVSAGAGDFGFVGFMGSSSTKTDADGVFAVDMLRPGKHTLRTASGKFLPTVQEFTLAPEEQRHDVVLVVRPGQAIAGQVVDERGVPVAGFKVGSKRKESRGGVAIERFATDEATTTDDNGFFTLSGLATETATVRAFGAGHTSATAADVAVGTGNLVLRVERLGSVEGVLVGTEGAPIGGSRVEVGAYVEGPGGGHVFEHGAEDDLPIGGRRTSATTNADGTFRLDDVRPGRVTVTATGAGHRPATQRDVQVLPGQGAKGVRLVADVGATARVMVVDEAGKPVAGAKVQAQRPEQAPQPGNGPRDGARRVEMTNDNGDVRIGGGLEALGSATTDAEGLAVLTGLPAGEAQLHATHAEHAPANPARVTLPKSGTVESKLTLLEPGFAEVLVTSAGGEPAEGASFRISGPTGEGSRDQSGKTNEAGLGRMGPLAAGEYTVALTRAAGTSRIGDMAFVSFGEESELAATQRQFTVKAGETTRIEIKKPMLTKVHGTVTGIDGPLAGCTVELGQQGAPELDMPGALPGIGGGARSTKTAADGSYALEDVESGSYTIRYGKPGQIVKATADLQVPPNQAEVRQDLVLRTGKVRVQACSQGTGEAISGAEVEIARANADASGRRPREQQRMVMMVTMDRSDSGGEATTMTLGSQKAQTGADGWAEIEDVPPGEYTVRVTHKKYAPVEMKGQVVVEQQTTDCGRADMTTAGRMRGVVVASDGGAVQMAMVQHRAAGASEWGGPTMAMGGSFRIDGLAPGKYAVRAQEIGRPRTFGPEVEVEVKGGEVATTELRLPEK